MTQNKQIKYVALDRERNPFFPLNMEGIQLMKDP